MAENIVAVAQAAKSTTQGANDTQTAAGELARMANELQRVVGHFKFDENVKGGATSGCRLPGGPGQDPHLASLLNPHGTPVSTRIQ